MLTELNPASTRCLMCASPKLRRFTAQASDTAEPTPVSIVECSQCCFAWQYPPGRTAEQSIDFFDHNYRTHGAGRTSYHDPTVKRAIAALELDFVTEVAAPAGRLLDVGAGSGMFAALAAERGWSVTAVDPALDDSLLDDHPGINAIRGTTALLSDREPFDVVTLLDVIEHVPAPMQALADAGSRIRDGGWIVVETGNYKSAERIEGGDRHWMFQLDHRWYFSPDSMSTMLADSGFADMVYSPKVLRPRWTGQTRYAGPAFTGLLKSVLKHPFESAQHFGRFRSLQQAADWPMAGVGIFAVAARKLPAATPTH